MAPATIGGCGPVRPGGRFGGSPAGYPGTGRECAHGRPGPAQGPTRAAHGRSGPLPRGERPPVTVPKNAVRKTAVLVLDCADPEPLAKFYAALLGATTRLGRDPDFVEVVGHDGVRLAVHRDHGHAPPSWPRPEDSLQAHLRILVPEEDMDEAEREAVGLGARPTEARGDGAHDTRTYTDPAGHSFSLSAAR